MHCMSEGYARFCEKSRGKVPLQGMQSNQMLRVRPTAEGRLEPVTGFEPWSFSIEPGRGICDHEKRTRDEAIARWVNNVPPEPQWDRLEINYLIQDDLPAEPSAEDPLFAIMFGNLELSEHQQAMLETPESRIAKLVFPRSIRDRATLKRKQKRKSKWAEKFRGVFLGKSSKKWAQRLGAGEDLQAEARGTAKARPRPASAEAASKKKTMVGKWLAKAHEKARGKKAATRMEADRRCNDKKRGREETEPCEESPWHDRAVRVLKENCYEGLTGVVTSVTKHKTEPTEPEQYRLQVLSSEGEGKGKMMLLEDDEVVLEDPKWAKPKPMHLDYRTSEIKARRSALADTLAIGAVEKVVPGTLLELGTVAAAMAEVAERVGVPEATTLIEPTIAVAWARDGIEPAAPNEEDEAFIKKVRTSSHLHMIVHSESPRHYTYVHVELQDEAVHKVEFKDSLADPAPSAARHVELILRNLGVASSDWQCPPRTNRGYQQGGWECGLWATRYLEQALREARFVGRFPLASVHLQGARLNKFIEFLKGARADEAAKASSEAKKKEAKTKAKARASASAGEVLRKKVEPQFETLEEALEAAQACAKCIATKAGVKIRQRARRPTAEFDAECGF